MFIKMENWKKLPTFTLLRELARLGLWEQTSFYSASRYNDFHIYRDADRLYFSCDEGRALLWVFE